MPAWHWAMLSPPQVTQGKDLLFKSGYKTLIVQGRIMTRPDSSQSDRQPDRLRQKLSKLLAFQIAMICSPLQGGSVLSSGWILRAPNACKQGPLEGFCSN